MPFPSGHLIFLPGAKSLGKAGPPALLSSLPGASGAGPKAVTPLPLSGAVRLLHWTGSQAGGRTWIHVDAACSASSSEGTRHGKRRRPGFAPRSLAPRTCILDPRPSPSSPSWSGRPWSSGTISKSTTTAEKRGKQANHDSGTCNPSVCFSGFLNYRTGR